MRKRMCPLILACILSLAATVNAGWTNLAWVALDVPPSDPVLYYDVFVDADPNPKEGLGLYHPTGAPYAQPVWWRDASHLHFFSGPFLLGPEYHLIVAVYTEETDLCISVDAEAPDCQVVTSLTEPIDPQEGTFPVVREAEALDYALSSAEIGLMYAADAFDYEPDGDVDGSDLSELANESSVTSVDISRISKGFGQAD